MDAFSAVKTNRRNLLGGGVALSLGAAALVQPAAAAGCGFSRVVDLTHLIVPSAAPASAPAPDAGAPARPSQQPSFSMDAIRTYDKDKMNINRWTVVEHSGTHIDAPLHFTANGPSLDTIPVSDLVVPLVLIDISSRAASNPETAVMPDDIRAWEAAHGALPAGCCVIMNSGWSARYGTPQANGRGADGQSHVPGFHIDTARMLMNERHVKGIGVDTSSLDQGSQARVYPVHNLWLPSGRWGLENLANLDQVPATGATLVVGAMKVKGATGGPARVMALV
jgi:kynurenine formamidase